ncbi:hypothetical protein ACIQZI_08200 [Peribacillus sp. NPDC096379]|uniref:hypothetical protein n=1 Tax=Peribacillus sp. NPDC096379 TaxID=3364393 RepID=UPI0037FD1D43
MEQLEKAFCPCSKWLSPDELKSLDWATADIPAIEKLSRTSMINECFRKRI